MGIYTAEAQESDIWSDLKVSWRDIARVGGTTGISDCGMAFDVGSSAYLHQHFAGTLGIVYDWLYQGEECDSETICPEDQEFHG